MTYCVKYHRGAVLPCTTRPQCMEECRAGWLAVSVACIECKRPTVGPFVTTVYDDGGQIVFYALLCADCSYKSGPHPVVSNADTPTVMMMTGIPRRPRPNP